MASESLEDLPDKGLTRHLAAIIVDSDDAIVSKDLSGRVLSWNKGAEKMFGYSAEEMIGRHIDILIPTERKDEEPGILSRIGRGERVEHYETVRVRKNGERIDVAISVSPVRDEKGNITGAAKIAREITARKRAERALREADMRKTEFLATLAHELRNPLAPLQSGIEILRELQGMPPVGIGTVEIMDRQLKHMVRLIDDLLDISRISRGRIELHLQEVDLRDVLQQAVETTRPLFARHGHQLHWFPPAHRVMVWADATRLSQVFSNLLNNAAKYTPANGEVHLKLKTTKNDVSVEVIDNGIGIPPDELSNVFEMFTQLDLPDSSLRSGLGIGLSLSKQFVLRHGGRLIARSQGVGKGSSFIVELPTLKSVQHSGSVDPGRSLRVMVVDQDEDNAISFAMIMESMGHQTVVASDLDEALRRGGTIRPDLIFIDMTSSYAAAMEIAHTIRTSTWGSSAYMVGVVAHTSMEDRRIPSGAFNDLLTKPVDRKLIMETLHKAGSRKPVPKAGHS